MKKKKSVRVRAERGFGPRHAFNAQEGSEAVPSELPSPPDWVEAQRRRVAPGQGLSNLTPGLLGGLGEAGSQLAGMSKEDAAKLAISMLAGGEGEMPLGEPGAVPLETWMNWKTVKPQTPARSGQPQSGAIKVDNAGNHYEMIGTHSVERPGAPYDLERSWHAIVKPVEAPGAQIASSPTGTNKNLPPTEGDISHLKGQNWLDAYMKKADEAGLVKPSAQQLQDALDALKEPPLEGPKSSKPQDEEPPFEPNVPRYRKGAKRIGVAKGFGPGHAENSKEGDLTQVNTDTVPAMLTPREAVLNRNAAELAGRGKIEALNAEGNQLAKKGVDLAAGGDNDVSGTNTMYTRARGGGSANLNGKQLWDVIMTALQGRQAPAEKLGPVPVPSAFAQKGDSDMNKKVKQSKPQSGSPYVQAFQNLMPKGGAPLGYQGGGGNVMGTQIGFSPGEKDPNTYSGLSPAQQNYFKNQGQLPPALGGPPKPGAVGAGQPFGGGMPPHQYNQYGDPTIPGGKMPQIPFGSGMPGGMPGNYFAGGGGMPGGYAPGTAPNGMPYQQGPMPYGGSAPNNMPYKQQAFADGTSNVGPIGTPPQGEQAYGPPVQLTSPQIQQLAKQTGINPSQIMALMKAFQGGQSAYNSIGGADSLASGGGGTGPLDAAGGFQGGISDIGYPPFVAPSASYDGNRGGWLGPYDPSFMIQRYAGGISSVP